MTHRRTVLQLEVLVLQLLILSSLAFYLSLTFFFFCISFSFFLSLSCFLFLSHTQSISFFSIDPFLRRHCFSTAESHTHPPTPTLYRDETPHARNPVFFLAPSSHRSIQMYSTELLHSQQLALCVRYKRPLRYPQPVLVSWLAFAEEMFVCIYI